MLQYVNYACSESRKICRERLGMSWWRILIITNEDLPLLSWPVFLQSHQQWTDQLMVALHQASTGICIDMTITYSVVSASKHVPRSCMYVLLFFCRNDYFISSSNSTRYYSRQTRTDSYIEYSRTNDRLGGLILGWYFDTMWNGLLDICWNSTPVQMCCLYAIVLCKLTPSSPRINGYVGVLFALVMALFYAE